MTASGTQPRNEDLPLFPAQPAPVNTRSQAMEKIGPKVGQLRGEVLAFITDRKTLGATDHEISAELNLLQDTARARRHELLDDGLVVDSGQRRSTPSGRSAAVWIDADCQVLGDDAVGPATASPSPQPSTAAGHTDVAVDDGHRGPIGLDNVALMLKREGRGQCAWCGGSQFWVSIFGVRTCRRCHPPAYVGLVAKEERSQRREGAKQDD